MRRLLQVLPPVAVIFGFVYFTLPFPCLMVTLAAFLALTVFVAFFLFLRRTNYRPWQWFRARRGWGKKPQELAQRLKVPLEELQFLETHYKQTFIAKKRGGTRRLLVPDAALKNLQRRILRRLLARLRVHPSAMGFEAGKSIVANAAPHVGQRVVIKMDLVDFFPTTSAQRVDLYFRRIGWNAESAALLTRLCMHEGSLPQGAPTSPRLSNLVNFDFDARLAAFVNKRKGQYTRYADDITVSLPKDYPRRVRGVIQFVCKLARKFGYRVHIKQKLRVLRRHQQQRVTGLVVNDKVQLPRKLRRWLRAVEHHLRTGKPTSISTEQLAGWRALQKMIASGNVSKGGRI